MTSGRNNTAARGRQAWHDADCADCARLSDFLAEVKRARPDYMCKPVPPFGARRAELLVVGLAPGLRGANATGRPFTGDHAGILLYRMLHRFGFASAPHSRARDDGLRLRNCRVTNAVKCLPPGNNRSARKSPTAAATSRPNSPSRTSNWCSRSAESRTARCCARSA